MNLPKELLYYTNNNWPIFPIYSPNHTKCSCNNPNCPSPAKHPLTHNGFYSATTNTALISYWLQKYPNCNWSIATGRQSNLVVIDVDVLKNGAESIKTFKIPITYTVLTGNGYHYYFKLPPKYHNLRSFNAILPGVDIKANFGYVIAPPSIHINGHQYETYLSVPPVMLPQNILNLLLARHNPLNQFTIGCRNNNLFKIGLGFAYNHYLNKRRLVKYLSAVNVDRCNPPLPTSELYALANNILKLVSRRTNGLSSYTETSYERRNYLSVP